MLTKALEEDDQCGFSSPEVLSSTMLSNEIGRQGTATSVVRECLIDFSVPTILDTNCTGVNSIVSGQVIVNATKIVGRITGNLKTPIVPMSDGPANISITNARFQNFSVTSGENGMIVHSGMLSGEIEPDSPKTQRPEHAQ